MREVTRIKEQVIEGEVGNPTFLAGAQPELLQFCRYLARSMVDGSAAAGAMFDEVVKSTEAWLTENVEDISDRHAFAVLMVAMETGLLAMHRQLSKALGADVLSPEGNLRLSKVKTEFYSTPLLSKELAQRARDAIDAVLAGTGGARRKQLGKGVAVKTRSSK